MAQFTDEFTDDFHLIAQLDQINAHIVLLTLRNHGESRTTEGNSQPH